MGPRLVPPTLLGTLLLLGLLAAYIPAVRGNLPGLDAEGEEWEADLAFCHKAGQDDAEFRDVCAQLLEAAADHAAAADLQAPASADAGVDADGYYEDYNEEEIEVMHELLEPSIHEGEYQQRQEHAAGVLQHLQPLSGWRAAGLAHTRRLHQQQQQQQQGESPPTPPPVEDIAALAAPSAAGGAAQATFTSPGTYTWVPPSGVTRVRVVCIGAGGGAGSYHPALWGTPEAGSAGGGGGEQGARWREGGGGGGGRQRGEGGRWYQPHPAHCS
jgi:hypothetical protein